MGFAPLLGHLGIGPLCATRDGRCPQRPRAVAAEHRADPPLGLREPEGHDTWRSRTQSNTRPILMHVVLPSAPPQSLGSSVFAPYDRRAQQTTHREAWET